MNFNNAKITTFHVLLLANAVSGFLFNFNPNHQQEQQAPQSFEDRYLNAECSGYLCPDTLECVSHAKDCPCPFPGSQLKCILPNDRYICISKPATHDDKLNQIYDDPVKGPKARNKGVRDCSWVSDAYKGLV